METLPLTSFVMPVANRSICAPCQSKRSEVCSPTAIASVTANVSGRVRREIWNGREYLVAPVTMIVSGVLAGSRGPLYYPPDQVAHDPGRWDGTPLVVYHPVRNGRNVSASHPGVMDKQGVGQVRYSHARGGKLKGEAWFDKERTRKVDPRVLSALEMGKQVEISTGLFTDNSPAPKGSVDPKGRHYEWVARDYKPDHLAILPDQIGACSIKDGCGILVNVSNLGLVVNEASIWQEVQLESSWVEVDNCGGPGGTMGPCPTGRSATESARVAGPKVSKSKTGTSKAEKPVKVVTAKVKKTTGPSEASKLATAKVAKAKAEVVKAKDGLLKAKRELASLRATEKDQKAAAKIASGKAKAKAPIDVSSHVEATKSLIARVTSTKTSKQFVALRAEMVTHAASLDKQLNGVQVKALAKELGLHDVSGTRASVMKNVARSMTEQIDIWARKDS